MSSRLDGGRKSRPRATLAGFSLLRRLGRCRLVAHCVMVFDELGSRLVGDASQGGNIQYIHIRASTLHPTRPWHRGLGGGGDS